MRLVGAAASLGAAKAGSAADAPHAKATVLFDDRSTRLDHVRFDPRDASALWVRQVDLRRINDFEVKPQGACRADVCIPISKDMRRGDYFNLTAFARKVGEPVVADLDARVWSFGEIQSLSSGWLKSRTAPDFTVPDRHGRPVHLADFRGKKVLVVTWASW
jgi:hypothetical protein